MWSDEMKSCTPVSREAHFQIKLYKTPNTPTTDHFWKLWCRKSARCCGAKHISKSKCRKHTMLGPLLEVDMSKNRTLWWREAHLKVKSVKNWRSRSIFRSWHIEKVHAVVGRSKFRSQEGYGALLDVRLSSCVAGTRDCAPCQKWAKREGFVAVSTTTTTTLHSTSLYCNYNYSYNYNYITLHYITPRYTSFFTPHSTTHRSTPLHNNTLHSITPRYTTLSTTTIIRLHCTTLSTPYTPLHFTTLHSITLHYDCNCSYNYNYTTLL